MAFREGLEAFLIVVILLKFLDKSNNRGLKKNVWYGVFVGVLVSLVFGLILMGVSSLLGGTGATAKLWESLASFVAVVLISTFIVWMINHGSMIKRHIENKAALSLSKKGVFLIALVMIAREGVEIAIFQFAGKYSAAPIVLGILLSIGFVVLIHYSLVKIKLKTIFTITLIYLILQSGFLIGYALHEGLSASKELGILEADNPIFAKAFDLSKTEFYHKEGVVGVPLYVAVGWYSKPEWVQFIVQYSYTILLFGYWYRRSVSVKSRIRN